MAHQDFLRKISKELSELNIRIANEYKLALESAMGSGQSIIRDQNALMAHPFEVADAPDSLAKFPLGSFAAPTRSDVSSVAQARSDVEDPLSPTMAKRSNLAARRKSRILTLQKSTTKELGAIIANLKGNDAEETEVSSTLPMQEPESAPTLSVREVPEESGDSNVHSDVDRTQGSHPLSRRKQTSFSITERTNASIRSCTKETQQADLHSSKGVAADVGARHEFDSDAHGGNSEVVSAYDPIIPVLEANDSRKQSSTAWGSNLATGNANLSTEESSSVTSEDFTKEDADVCDFTATLTSKELRNDPNMLFAGALDGRIARTSSAHSSAITSMPTGNSEERHIAHFEVHKEFQIHGIDELATGAIDQVAKLNYDFETGHHELEEDEALLAHTKHTTPFTNLIQRLMLHPASGKRLCWDIFGIALIAFDAVMIPLQMAFRFSKIEAMIWLSCVFWSIDLISLFFVGYVKLNGQIEMRFVNVARKYLKTWFALDILLLILNWLEFIKTMDFAGMRYARMFRAFRMFRLMRLAKKTQEMSSSFAYRMRNEQLMIILGIMKTMLLILMLMHIIACMWYAIGTSTTKVNWLLKMPWGVPEVEAVEDIVRGVDPFYLYVASFYWAFTQFIAGSELLPQNLQEQVFALIVVMLGFLSGAYVVSSLTTSMTQLHMITAHHSKQLLVLRRYLVQNDISRRLASRVLRCAQNIIDDQRRRIDEGSVELLTFVSLPLRIELHYEVNVHTLKRHPFFYFYNRRNAAAMRQLCHTAVSRQALSQGDVLFSEGESPLESKMYFVLRGTMQYIRNSRKISSLVSEGEWAGEVVLWAAGWTYKGTMRAHTDSQLLCVNSEDFRTIAKKFQTRCFYSAVYASYFVDALNEVHSLAEAANADGEDVSKPDVPFLSELETSLVNSAELATLTFDIDADQEQRQSATFKRSSSRVSLTSKRSSCRPCLT